MRQFLFTLAFCSFFITSFAQQGNLSKVDRIYYTCKIWGYLKYYHPLISKGSFDWDEKMQKVLGITAKYQTYPEFSDYMAKWIYYMGEVKPCAGCKQRNSDEHFLENFDLSWTQNRLFSDELKKTLKNIETNRFQGNHFYIDQGKVGEFIPKNEQPYLDLNWKDEDQRLIPLFRYWNYIEYFYPYKYLTDQNWDDVLKEMIPKFLDAQTKLDFHLVMLELVVKIDDSHAGLMTSVLDEMPYYNYLPARFDLIENQLILTEIIDSGKAQQQDLQVGDVLKTINSQSALDLHNANKKYIWGSNEGVKDRSIYHTLFMGMQGPIQATIERNGSVRTVSLNLYKYSDLSYAKTEPKPKWTIPNDSIGYVNMGALTIGDVNQMMSELIDKTAIIFDLRNNPKGTYKAIAKYLNPTDTTFAIYTKPDYSYPGKFVWQGEATCGEANEEYYRGKVILLVDENTQSHAEFTCMSLQTAPNVVTIGSQTAGTDGKVTKFPIVSRLYTAMSGMGVYYPNQQATQRIGITRDINIVPTADGIIAGRDEVLEKGMEIAKEEIAREIAEAKAALAKAIQDSLRQDSLRLDSLRRFSLKMDSLQINTLPMDSLKIDSIKVDDN
ncbi:S41 family peptidase [Ekhidna sp.]|uniref:S41 family peptidase n=1 Tax=Ekhidna sp. TaxID=2608089 RepID=UPI0032992FAA